MARRVGKHFQGNVVGYVALFFALGLGTAWAFEANSVKSKHIAPDAAKGADIDESTLKLPSFDTGVVPREGANEAFTLFDDGTIDLVGQCIDGGGGFSSPMLYVYAPDGSRIGYTGDADPATRGGAPWEILRFASQETEGRWTRFVVTGADGNTLTGTVAAHTHIGDDDCRFQASGIR